MNKYCIKCGEKLEDNSLFCGKCGANQETPELTIKNNLQNNSNINIRPVLSAPISEPVKPNHRNNRNMLIYIVCIIVITIVISVITIPLKNEQKNTNNTSSSTIKSDDLSSPITAEDPLNLPALSKFESLMNNAIIDFYDKVGIDVVANDYLLSNYEILDTSEEAVYEYMISFKYGPSKNICLMGTANNDRVEYVSTFIFLNEMKVDGSTLSGLTQMIMISAGLFDNKYSNLENLRSLMTDLLQNGTQDKEGTTATLVINNIEYSLTITNAMVGFAVNARDENIAPTITSDAIHTHVFGNWANTDDSSHARTCSCSESV